MLLILLIKTRCKYYPRVNARIYHRHKWYRFHKGSVLSFSETAFTDQDIHSPERNQHERRHIQRESVPAGHAVARQIKELMNRALV